MGKQSVSRTCVLGGVFFAVMSCILFGSVSAQAFSVEPAIQELRLLPGTSEDRELVFRNTEEVPVRIALSVQAFEAGTGGEPRFLDPSYVAGLPSWIRVSAPVFELDPGASRRVRVQITAPPDAERRGYYAAIIASEQLSGESSVGFARRIATLWMVSVGGEQDAAVPKLAFQGEASVRWKLFGRGGFVETSLHNTGIVHGATRVRTTVRPWFGPSVLHEQDVRLLPDEVRMIQGSWKGLWPTARLDITQELVNDQGKTVGLVRTLHWVPETVVAGIGIGVGFLLSVVAIIRRSRRRRFTV